jgi:CheY-like chemotaxis protein
LRITPSRYGDDNLFHFCHTRYDAVPGGGMALEQGTSMAQSIRVLIADDSARAREGLCALLKTWHAVEVVGEAANGREALALVAERQPDIVLIDLQMPVMDGLEATRRIKGNWPGVMVIMLTMHAAQQAAARAAGADDFVIKGSAPQRLLSALASAGVAGEQTL